MDSQEKQILDYLKTGAGITPLEALHKFQCFRLGARIFGLKKKGYLVQSEMIKVENDKHVARYWLVQKPQQLKLSM